MPGPITSGLAGSRSASGGSSPASTCAWKGSSPASCASAAPPEMAKASVTTSNTIRLRDMFITYPLS